MSQTIKVLKWCDNELVHGADSEPATVQRFVLNEAGKPVELDLCAVDDLKVQAVLELAKYGTPVASAPIRPKSRSQGQRAPDDAERKFPCPRCDYSAINRDGLGKHTRRQHGLQLADALTEIKDQAGQSHPSSAPSERVVMEGPLPQRAAPVKSNGMGRPRADAPKPWKCKVPRCQWPGSVSENGIYQHITKDHNLTRVQYRQRYGAPVEETD